MLRVTKPLCVRVIVDRCNSELSERRLSKDGIMMDRVRRAKSKVLGGGSKGETVVSEAL